MLAQMQHMLDAFDQAAGEAAAAGAK